MKAFDSFGVRGGIRFVEGRALRVEILPAIDWKRLRLCFVHLR